MSIDKALVGRRLRRLRKDRQLTQKVVAEGLGLTDQYLSKLERGVTLATLRTLGDAADFFGVDIAVIVAGANYQSPDYAKYDLFFFLEDATPDQREAILEHTKIVMKTVTPPT